MGSADLVLELLDSTGSSGTTGCDRVVAGRARGIRGGTVVPVESKVWVSAFRS